MHPSVHGARFGDDLVRTSVGRVSENGAAPALVGATPRAVASLAASESARYYDSADRQIYTVAHAAETPRRGGVLLCGPIGVERERAYLTLVRWARVLASRGFDVLRFDYRGNGESSGRFEHTTIARWCEDAAFCAARLAAAVDGEAVILHGVRLGAVIAAELFASGVGDGLLVWAPPVSAQALLMDTLRHNVVAQQLAATNAPRRVRAQLIAALETGELINVDGYFWTLELWAGAKRHPLLLPATSESRPWHALQVRGAAHDASEPNSQARVETVDADTFWKSSSPLLVPRSDAFFRASLRWFDQNEPWSARST